MSLFLNNESGDNAQLFTSRVGRLESDEPAEKPTISDALFPEDGDDDNDGEYIEQDEEEEPVDEDGDPTGEHDHQQDDNYALGGHVTRSGS